MTKKHKKEDIAEATSTTSSEKGTSHNTTIEVIKTHRNFLIPAGLVAVAGLIALTALVTVGDEDGTLAILGEENTAELTDEEVSELVEQVRGLIFLPEDEIPLVATVVNAEALQAEQPFYQDVQNGDRLLIYGESLKAIIYRPSENQLVNVGPVQYNQEAQPSQEGAVDTE